MYPYATCLMARSILRNLIYLQYLLILQSMLGKQLRKFRHASFDQYPEVGPGEVLNPVPEKKY